MEHSDYPAMVPQLPPGQAVDVLQDRVREIGKLNTSIADWLQERRRLEEQYATGLRKLARHKIDDVDLGIFSIPWTSITDSADTMADAHSALASKIDVDVERPLRDFASSNPDMASMPKLSGNLGSLAKDLDKAEHKTERLRAKGDEAKAPTAGTELNNAQSQWELEAPVQFDKLQGIDEARLNQLRDVLTQFQTHELDQIEKSRQTAEHCLNVLLQVETTDEIKTFVLKALSGAGRPRPSQVDRATSSRAPLTGGFMSPARSTTETESNQSGSVQEEKRKSRFGGLKRLGTVIRSKDKDTDKRKSKMPSQLAPMAESPETSENSRSSPFSTSRRFGRRDSSTPNLEPPKSSAGRPRSPLRQGSEILEPTPSLPAAEPATPSPAQRGGPAGRINGTTAAIGGVAVAGAAGTVATAAMLNGHHNDLAGLDPPAPSQLQQPAERPIVAEPTKDSEGFSVPPPQLDPISQAQQDAAAFDAEPSATSTPAFNVNIRDKPIQDGDATDADAALSSAATKLQAPPSVMPRSAGTLRGRRAGRPTSMLPPEHSNIGADSFSRSTTAPIAEVQSPPPAEASRAVDSSLGQPSLSQSTTSLTQAPSGSFSPAPAAVSAFAPFTPATNQTSPIRSDSQVIAPNLTGDNQSIRSGRSTASQGGLKHPELSGTGLNSSIVETVSARFENGSVVSSSLIGEIALAYNPADFSSPFGSENIRVENFSSLEKVAPNPAFITQSPAHKEGEYSVNLSSIGKTQVAFKYQVKNLGTQTHAPLLITPAFRIEPTQASVIISYSLNPAFNLHGKESVTVSNAMLALTLEGATATSCQSRPAGTFSREKNLIFWQLGDVTLKAGAAPEKVLARFATESEAKTGHVEARWDISGEIASALGSGLQISVQGGPTGDGSDPFADQEAAGLASVWKGVPVLRKLVAGSYVAK